MSVYLQRINELIDSLASINEHVPESDLIMYTLNGVGREYDNFVITAQNKDVPFSFGALRSRLIQHEQWLASHDSDLTKSLDSVMNSAFFTKNTFHKDKASTSSTDTSFNTSSKDKPRKNTPTPYKITDFSNITCQICKKNGHTASKCYYRYTQPKNNGSSSSQENMCIQVNTGFISEEPTFHIDVDWLPDSGATAHMTNDLSVLHDTSLYTGSDSVLVGNGNHLDISMVGTSALQTDTGTFTLPNVLYVPTLHRNLISVGKFTAEHSCSIEFLPWGYKINDLATKQLLAEGKIDKHLYPIIPKSAPCAQAHVSIQASPTTWNCRFGRTSNSILQKMCFTSQIQLTFATSNSLCAPCQLGKSKRLPFQPSTRSSTAPLELIHCDIWGPAPVVSSLGYKYYILFIDDFTKFHWIYPISTRYESLMCFQHFKNLNEKLLSHSIKLFQTDGALELVKGRFKDFLDQFGINIYVSFPHTPQQNGVAERKHRHITEMGNTMSFQACLPKNF